MIAYILVVLFPFFAEVLYKSRLKEKELSREDPEATKMLRRYVLLAALPMFFLIAFRNQSIGADTNGYLENFQRTINVSWSDLEESSRMEYGYLVFVKLLTYVTHNPLVFQIIYTSIYLFALASFVNELEEEHFFFLFLFGALGSYTFMFTGVRQCLAMSICLFSFRFVKRRKPILFALLLLLAFQFHKSAVLFAMAYLIYPRKLSVLNVLLYFGVASFAVVYLEELQAFLNDQLDYDYGIEGQTGGIIFAVVMMVITVFTMVMTVSSKSLNRSSRGLINVGLVAMICWVLRIFTRIAERPSFYFLPFSFAALAYAVSTMKDKKEKKFTKTVIVVFALALYIYKFMTNFVKFVPYSFYSANF